MATYVLVRSTDGAIIDQRDFAETPPDVTRKGIAWRPLVVTDPAFDPATQVKTGPVLTTLADKVTKAWSVRTMTADELDAVKAAAVDAVDSVALKVLFNHENRVRALEGKQAVTSVQFRNAFKAML